ncbi:hypothetical protein LJC68_00150 [Bacteroidales bacterium OttesenSCG-928-B11]|nr:hypothetical protein [Bacteroidales bacterium OttesenSCG-928-E04]MDL2308411.1 hypothetical protein [Bacteroidales bacterium OttesenSCG-928-C03]MDL2311275.1 hypothetical protein [Bacteroidales bacterium OttesenSCG-928-B11]
MKKWVLLILLSIFVLTTYGQNKVRGKYKGKEIKIEYYSGQPADFVSVEYELVDDLNKEIAKLKSSRDRLQLELNRLKEGAGMSKNDAPKDSLFTSEEQIVIDFLTGQVEQLDKEIEELRKKNQTLISQIDSLLSEKNRPAARAPLSEREHYGGSIFFNINMGSPMLFGHISKIPFWNSEATLSQSYQIMYESPQINPITPITLSAGVGISRYVFKQNMLNEEFIYKNDVTIDGTEYDRKYNFHFANEKLSLLYLDIPIGIAIGCPRKMKVSGWGKIGVVASFKLASKFYDQKSYHVQILGENLGDIREIENGQYDINREITDNDLNKFLFSGFASGGVYIPFYNQTMKKYLPIVLKLGVNCSYTFTKLSKGEVSGTDPLYIRNRCNLIEADNTRFLNIGFELGLHYLFN